MITAPDFSKKQIVFVLFNDGEKLAFRNDNIVVKRPDGGIKFQVTCYRLFAVYAVGHCSLTSVVIQKAKKFGFFIVMLTPSFRIYAILGGEKDGNTLLRRKQYEYTGLELARHITDNKIANQQELLRRVRCKNDCIKEAIPLMEQYRQGAQTAGTLQELMGFEGMASRLYFRNHFNNIVWNGRQPRIKPDAVNAVLDIGYTLLFSFVDSLLLSFGFDTFCGVMHREFYMRKSLTCDIVEPFRVLIDHQVKKSLNLGQIRDEDFLIDNRQYRLRWEHNARYLQFLMKPIMENKEAIFLYVQSYYRCFMKGADPSMFPVFIPGGEP